MKLYPSKILFSFGLLALIPAVISLVVAIEAAIADTSEGRVFFKLCSTQIPEECTNFSWQQLACVGAVSLFVSIVLLVLANKKIGGGSGA